MAQIQAQNQHDDVTMTGVGDTMSNASSESPITEKRPRRKVAPLPVDDEAEAGATRRSGRARKKPKTEEEIVESTRLISKSTKTKGRKLGVWTADHLLSSKRSKIIHAELSALINPATWDIFTAEEQDELLSLLPTVDYELTFPGLNEAASRISPTLLFSNLNNDAFKSSFRELQDDLENGYWEPSYVKKAEEAARLRAEELANAIDQKKNNEYEEWWGQKQKINHDNAGQATKVSIYELCQKRLLRIADIFEYRRNFKECGVVVEKQFQLEEIEYIQEKGSCALTFSMAPGTKRFASGEEKKQVTIASFGQLEKVAVNEDGRIPILPNGNGWKSFKVFRNHEWVGSTHEIRQRFYEKNG